MANESTDQKADASQNRAMITRTYIRYYSDNRQATAYVDWSDGSRTEGDPSNEHIKSLFARAQRDGIKSEMESW